MHSALLNVSFYWCKAHFIPSRALTDGAILILLFVLMIVLLEIVNAIFSDATVLMPLIYLYNSCIKGFHHGGREMWISVDSIQPQILFAARFHLNYGPFPLLAANYRQTLRCYFYQQVTKKFSEWKQAHVGMEPSKTNQTRWECHHNTFTPSLHP